MSQKKKNAIKEINAAITECVDYYGWCAESSYRETLPTLKPGETAPEGGKIHGEKYQGLYNGKVYNAMDRANKALESWRESINHTLTDAPSEEALRAVQAFQLRNKERLTKEAYGAEIQRLIDRYGDNYQIYEALLDMAMDKEVGINAMLKPNPAIKEAEDFEFVENSYKSVFTGPGGLLSNSGSPSTKASFIVSQLNSVAEK